VHNYHIDGFRFDLASILSRGRNGELLPSPPLVEMIAEDPMLADTKVIAEAWDAAGAYQVGSFANLRWAEWNGRYRDDARRYWRGDSGLRQELATRLAGSSDLYQSSSRQPYHSINFITSHDGFTLGDLVTYVDKHNEANGEGNRDGDNNNFSANYGVEGPTDRRDINAVRLRQIKNILTTLLLSQGVPMIVFGDECRRTQRGNNNAYCQDNEVSWFDWTLVEQNADLWRFVRELIAFRRGQPAVRRKRFLSSEPRRPGMLPDASWFGADGKDVDWHSGDSSLQLLLGAPMDAGVDPDVARHVLIMLHAGAQRRRFTFPNSARRIEWRLLVDTSAASPADFHPDMTGPRPPLTGQVTLAERSMMVFVARPIWPAAATAKKSAIEIIDDDD
jgi:glycogen operon protein